jgi:leucyl/phenylalanyl-tRNA--protein transferase
VPVFRLLDEPAFPLPDLADATGLLAVGGDLSSTRLLLAYSMGVFPWYNPGEPILWWSPDPRCILETNGMTISRSLAKTLRRGVFEVTFDRAFRRAMEACGEVRLGQGEGTWISAEMLAAYGQLHDMGFAHSVECWSDGELVGGLYGVSLGRCFFGESMFHRRTDASKVALAVLAQRLDAAGFELIDCQLSSSHLLSLGARQIPRREFLDRLRCGGVIPSLMPAPGFFPES